MLQIFKIRPNFDIFDYVKIREDAGEWASRKLDIVAQGGSIKFLIGSSVLKPE